MSHDAKATLDALETERANPASANIDTMGAMEIARLMNSEDVKVAAAVHKELPRIARAMEGIAERLRGGGRLIYVGAGTSGRLGVLDASECPPTFSTPPGMVVGLIAGGNRALTHSVEEIEDHEEEGRADLERIGASSSDAIVGLAASGRTPYVLGALKYAGEVGALTVGVACNADTPLERCVEIMIAPIPGPEVITGSTRLKSGTAQKMVLNMLSTGAMVLLGKTLGNLMVDLRPTNSKLRIRSVRILREISGLGEREAQELLKTADGDTKVAIVAALAGVEANEARRLLELNGGKVRFAVEASSK